LHEIKSPTGSKTGNKGYYPRKVVEVKREVLFMVALIATLVAAIFALVSDPPPIKQDPLEEHFMRVETHR
tara:strand:- start:248 stop:457 length:210 start_codon:yes stop_codon:yes gene_type:complete